MVCGNWWYYSLSSWSFKLLVPQRFDVEMRNDISTTNPIIHTSYMEHMNLDAIETTHTASNVHEVAGDKHSHEHHNIAI